MGYLTLADFLVTEFSFYLEKIAPEAFAKYSFLAKIRKSFEDLPEIKKYYESETAVKGPFFPPGFGVIDFWLSIQQNWAYFMKYIDCFFLRNEK